MYYIRVDFCNALRYVATSASSHGIVMLHSSC